MESIEFKKDFFDLLSFIKYVLESKVAVPFLTDENRRPFEKPFGYDFYDDNQDKKDYVNLGSSLRDQIDRRVKRYHYLRSRFAKIVRGLILVTNIRGGQHTISFQMFKVLGGFLTQSGITISYEKKNSVYVLSKSLRKNMLNIEPVKVSFFKSIRNFFNNFFNKPTMSNLYKIRFRDGENSFSITAFVYYIDRKPSLISFLEYSLKTENYAGGVLKKMKQEINDNIRLLPIMDIID